MLLSGSLATSYRWWQLLIEGSIGKVISVRHCQANSLMLYLVAMRGVRILVASLSRLSMYAMCLHG